MFLSFCVSVSWHYVIKIVWLTLRMYLLIYLFIYLLVYVLIRILSFSCPPCLSKCVSGTDDYTGSGECRPQGSSEVMVSEVSPGSPLGLCQRPFCLFPRLVV